MMEKDPADTTRPASAFPIHAVARRILSRFFYFGANGFAMGFFLSGAVSLISGQILDNHMGSIPDHSSIVRRLTAWEIALASIYSFAVFAWAGARTAVRNDHENILTRIVKNVPRYCINGTVIGAVNGGILYYSILSRFHPSLLGTPSPWLMIVPASMTLGFAAGMTYSVMCGMRPQAPLIPKDL
jgi:hypothetical protein